MILPSVCKAPCWALGSRNSAFVKSSTVLENKSQSSFIVDFKNGAAR